MNADIRQIVAEFAITDRSRADPLCALRATSRAWHDAVVAAIRFHGPTQGGPTTVLQALLCPDMVTTELSLDAARCVFRAAMAWSPRGCLDLVPFSTLPLADPGYPRMLGPLWAIVEEEHIQRLLLPPNVTVLVEEGFSCMNMESLTLPATVTEIGRMCFAGAKIADLVFSPRELREVGVMCFNRFHTQSLDLRAATNLTALPDSCFHAARLKRLLLPGAITMLGKYCFEGAKIDEMVLPVRELRAVGEVCFHGFHTPALDLREATNLTVLPDNCFSDTRMTRLQLPAGITHIGPNGFARADIADFDLPAAGIITLGYGCFNRFRTLMMDLRSATHIRSLPDCCFADARMARLLLPASITQLDQFCFAGAKIAEFVLPACELIAVQRQCFASFHTQSLDLSEASKMPTELPSDCFDKAKIAKLQLPKCNA